jgi:nucleoside-diphosphate-sugar epimerase
MKNVVVTGGSGKAGRAVVRELVEHGYAVLNVDLVPSADPACAFLKADLTDLGQAIEALQNASGIIERRRPFGASGAVVHLAGIPAPGLQSDSAIVRNNFVSTYNVFSAATRLGVSRVVWASSETVLGLPFTRRDPDVFPVTEEQTPLPENGYALVKLLCEEMARQMHRWNPGTSFVGLRISNIMEEADYAAFPSFAADASLRQWNLWGYVDARDVAQACRLGIEAPFAGADHFIIAATDTVMERPSRELAAEIFPNVRLTRELEGRETLLAIDKARRVLGYEPRFSWLSQVRRASAG